MRIPNLKIGIGLNSHGWPCEEGWFKVESNWDSCLTEIEVYNHPIKGLCCFSDDFGSDGTGVNDETDCHVSVQYTGLTFLGKIKDLN